MGDDMKYKCDKCLWGNKVTSEKVFCMLPGRCLDSSGNDNKEAEHSGSHEVINKDGKEQIRGKS